VEKSTKMCAIFVIKKLPKVNNRPTGDNLVTLASLQHEFHKAEQNNSGWSGSGLSPTFSFV
jgi:hypothetical protein